MGVTYIEILSHVKRLSVNRGDLEAPVVLNQVHYNLIYREPEITGLLDYCRGSDMFLMAWRPLEKGAILKNRPPVLDEICVKYRKSPARVAINWLTSQDQVITLCTMRSEGSLQDNLGAVGWYMEPEDVEKLRVQFPGQKVVSNREPLV